MPGEGKLKISVKSFETIKAKHALPSTIQHRLKESIQTVDIKDIQEDFNSLLESVFCLLSKAKTEQQGFAVDAVKFTLGINAKGNVSLVTLASAEIGAQATIEVSIKRI